MEVVEPDVVAPVPVVDVVLLESVERDVEELVSVETVVVLLESAVEPDAVPSVSVVSLESVVVEVVVRVLSLPVVP